MKANIRCEFLWLLLNLNKKPKTHELCIINLCAFYFSCSPGFLIVWARWNPLAYPEGRLVGWRVQSLLIFYCVFAQKYCPSSSPVFMKSKKCAQKNVNNCTLISHFFCFWGLCPQTLCQGFAQNHTGERKFPSPMSPSLLHNSWSIPCQPPPLWNTGYADGETHPNYHIQGPYLCLYQTLGILRA